MTLKERLLEDMKTAMRDHDKERLSVIRMARAAILKIEKDTMKELDENGVLDVLTKEVKQRRDSIVEFKRGDRQDLVDQAEREIAILIEYLPKQLSIEELKEIVNNAIQETGATTMKDMGKVMAKIMPQTKGKADGKVINELVKEYLQ